MVLKPLRSPADGVFAQSVHGGCGQDIDGSSRRSSFSPRRLPPVIAVSRVCLCLAGRKFSAVLSA